MSHSLAKIWIHGIFGTKNRKALIKPNFEDELYEHLKNRLENDLDCKVQIINGVEDHVHILFLLSQKYSIQDVFKNIKGESSHWINQNDFSKNKFSWQVGYGAFSVSGSKVKDVENYILKQKGHHANINFLDEYNNLMKSYDILVRS